MTPNKTDSKNTGPSRGDPDYPSEYKSKGFFSRLRNALAQEEEGITGQYTDDNEKGGVVLVAKQGTKITISQQTDGDNVLDDSGVSSVVMTSTTNSMPIPPPIVMPTSLPPQLNAGNNNTQKNNSGSRKPTPTASHSSRRGGKGNASKGKGNNNGNNSNISGNGSTSLVESSSEDKVLGSPSQDLDADAKAQVLSESEAVWAQAEAWVESQVAAEEEAWQRIEKKSKSKVRRDIDAVAGSKVGFSVSQSPSMDTSTSTRDLPQSTPSTTSTSKSRSPHLELEIPEFLGHSSNVDDEAMEPARSVAGEGSLHPYSPAASSTRGIKVFGMGYPHMRTPGSMGACSPASSVSTSASTPHSSGRSLHAKLSSPDRRKVLSPTEAMRRHEARQSAANNNRYLELEARREKASIASSRVARVVSNKKREKEQAVEKMEDRLNKAEKRHEEHMRNVKGKAENENAKVSEIMFINNLNDAVIAEELQRRLSEVEARTWAAYQRRQERLTGISAKQQKRNSKKSQQMSALRLQLEQQKQERWEKLQTRLDGVHARREARMAELQRRREEGDDDQSTSEKSARRLSGGNRATMSRTNSAKEEVDDEDEGDDYDLGNDNDNNSVVSSTASSVTSMGRKKKKKTNKSGKHDTEEIKLLNQLILENQKTLQSAKEAKARAAAVEKQKEASNSGPVSAYIGNDTVYTNSFGNTVPLSPSSKPLIDVRKTSSVSAVEFKEETDIVSQWQQLAQSPLPVSDGYRQWEAIQKKRAVSTARQVLLTSSAASGQKAPVSLMTLLDGYIHSSVNPAALQGKVGALALHMLGALGAVHPDEVPTNMPVDVRTASMTLVCSGGCRKFMKTFEAFRSLFRANAKGQQALTMQGACLILTVIDGINLTDPIALAAFKHHGGAVLLLMLFDAETGLLSPSPEAGAAEGTTVLHALLKKTRTTAMLTRACQLTQIVCTSLEDNGTSESKHVGIDLLYTLGAMVSDTVLICMHILESALRQMGSNMGNSIPATSTQKESSVGKTPVKRLVTEEDDKENMSRVDGYSQSAGNTAPLSPRNSMGSKGGSLQEKEGKDVINKDTQELLCLMEELCAVDGAAISAETLQMFFFTALSHLMEALSTLMTPTTFPPMKASDGSGDVMEESKLNLQWYLSTLGFVSASSHLFRAVSTLPLQMTAPLMISMSDNIRYYCWFLRQSAIQPEGTDVIEKVSSLSIKKFRHTQCKGMCSLLRQNKITECLTAALEHQNMLFDVGELSEEDAACNHQVCAALICALLATGSADINLLQNMPDTAQFTLALTLLTLLKRQVDVCEEEPRVDLWVPYCLTRGDGYVIAQSLALIGLLYLRNKNLQLKTAQACKSDISNGETSDSATPMKRSPPAMLPAMRNLCQKMPVRYYSEERYKMQLIPTLVSMSIDCAESLAICEQEMTSLLMLDTHMSRLQRDLQDFKRDSCSDASVPAQLVQLSARFPTELWQPFIKMI